MTNDSPLPSSRSTSGLFIWSLPRKRSALPESATSLPSSSFEVRVEPHRSDHVGAISDDGVDHGSVPRDSAPADGLHRSAHRDLFAEGNRGEIEELTSVEISTRDVEQQVGNARDTGSVELLHRARSDPLDGVCGNRREIRQGSAGHGETAYGDESPEEIRSRPRSERTAVAGSLRSAIPGRLSPRVVPDASKCPAHRAGRWVRGEPENGPSDLSRNPTPRRGHPPAASGAAANGTPKRRHQMRTVWCTAGS